MLSLKSQFVESEPRSATARWALGIEPRRVALYVALALIGGFAGGFVVSKYWFAETGQEISPAIRSDKASTGGLETAASAATTELLNVTRVMRADMIEVEGVGPVQMIGIETPDGKSPAEIYGDHGQRALAFTQSSVSGRKVRLEFDTANSSTDNKGPSGQTLAYVYTEDGRLLNRELLTQGHAFAQTSQPFGLINEFRTSERDAMQAMRGVWGFAGSPPVASNSIPDPLASTAKEEKRKLSPLAPSEIGPNVPATSGLSGPITPSEPLVMVSSGDRMYHKSGCEYLGKKHNSLGVSQAKAEGYSSCSRCFASTVLKAR